MLTRQLRDFRKNSGPLPSPGPMPGGRLRTGRLRRESVSGLTKGSLLVRRLTKLTTACPAGRLAERLTGAGLELNEEALHVLESQEELYGKLSLLASEIHCDLVAAQDGADELSAKRMEAETEANKLARTMENMRSKLKLLEENFNQSDDVLARLVYGDLSLARFTDNVKKGATFSLLCFSVFFSLVYSLFSPLSLSLTHLPPTLTHTLRRLFLTKRRSLEGEAAA